MPIRRAARPRRRDRMPTVRATPMPAEALRGGGRGRDAGIRAGAAGEGGWLLRGGPGRRRGADARASGRARRCGGLDLASSTRRSSTIGSGSMPRTSPPGIGSPTLGTRAKPSTVSRRGEVRAAILVRPTQLDQLAAVANAGDVMPQKSTYFYPKLLTGMVFNPLGGRGLEERQQPVVQAIKRDEVYIEPEGIYVETTSARAAQPQAAARCWSTARSPGRGCGRASPPTSPSAAGRRTP